MSKMNFNESFDHNDVHIVAGGAIFNNPNPGQGIKEAEQLNGFSKEFRSTNFIKQKVATESFELNPMNFEWEYIIDLKNGSRIAMVEQRGEVRCFYYKKKDQPNETWKVSYGKLKKNRMKDCMVEIVKHWISKGV
ncbi:MAG: hypothetical protein ACOYNN_14550 [Terrimicrobiaceae bacterium]|jgi:hypothetical protein